MHLVKALGLKAAVADSKFAAWLHAEQAGVLARHQADWEAARQAAGEPTQDYCGKGYGSVPHVVLYWRDAVVRGMGMAPAAALTAASEFELRDAAHPEEDWRQGIQRFEQLLARCPRGETSAAGRWLFQSVRFLPIVMREMASRRNEACHRLNTEPAAYTYDLATVKGWLQQAWGWWEQEPATQAPVRHARTAAAHTLAHAHPGHAQSQSAILARFPAAAGEVVPQYGPRPTPEDAQYCLLHQTPRHGEAECWEWKRMAKTFAPEHLALAIRQGLYAQHWNERQGIRGQGGAGRGGRSGRGGQGSRGAGDAAPPPWQRQASTFTTALQDLKRQMEGLASAQAAMTATATAAVPTPPQQPQPPVATAAPAVTAAPVVPAAPAQLDAAIVAHAAAAAVAMLHNMPQRTPAGVHVTARAPEEEEVHAPSSFYQYPAANYITVAPTAVLRGPMPQGFMPASAASATAAAKTPAPPQPTASAPAAGGSPRAPQQPARATGAAALLIPLLEQMRTIGMRMTATEELMQQLLEAAQGGLLESEAAAALHARAQRTSTVSVITPGYVELATGFFFLRNHPYKVEQGQTRCPPAA